MYCFSNQIFILYRYTSNDITDVKYRLEKRTCYDKQIEHEITLKLDIHKIWIRIR